MRQLFRKEYAKEQEEMQVSMSTEPGGMEISITTGRRSAPIAPPSAPPMATPPTGLPIEPAPPAPPPPLVAAPPAAPPPLATDEKPRGFWGSLFKKRK